MTVRMGFVGAGTIARQHADHLADAGCSIAGVYDLAPNVADTFAGHYDCRAFREMHDLLECDDVDAVIIAVPNAYHAPCAVMALEAGKDVLLEKPMALNIEQCDEILAAAKKYDRILQLGFVCRHFGPAVAAHQFIRERKLGRIYHAKTTIVRRRGIPGLGGWFTTKAISGGGPLVDLGVHVIDLAWHLMGYPKPLRASAATYAAFGSPIADYVYTDMWAGPPRLDGTFDVEDAATGLVRFEGGLTLEVNTIWASDAPEGALVDGTLLLGDRGGLHLDHLANTIHFASESCGHLVDIAPHLPDTNPWISQLASFAHCVRTREPSTAPGEHGRVIQSILDAMYRSAELEREVEI
jgi:predicted dehydrogenase